MTKGRQTSDPRAKRPARGWRPKEGNWHVSTATLKQTDPETVTRCYDRLGVPDLVASFRFRLDQEGSNGAEVKFIYSAANRSEEYRVDFLYRLSACRVTAKTWGAVWPLDLISGREFEARIRVRANVIRVDVNGMAIVPGFSFGRVSDGVVGFGTWSGAATFDQISLKPYEQRKCFVIMPYDRDRNLVHEDAIRPALDSHPDFVFDCVRADEALTVGKIMEEIDEFIDNADLLIADITTPNPNVYYELGYGHARRKKALLLAEDGNDLSVPFDIKDFRHHRYSVTRAGLDALRIRIQEVATTILTTAAA
jgi:hypothetical protein